MNIFSNIFSKTDAGEDLDFSYDQCVLITISTNRHSDFYNSIKELEGTIEEALPQNSGLDGDEFSSNDATIYLYGPDADGIFKVVRPILSESSFDNIEVNLQYGQADDPNLKEKTVFI